MPHKGHISFLLNVITSSHEVSLDKIRPRLKLMVALVLLLIYSLKYFTGSTTLHLVEAKYILTLTTGVFAITLLRQIWLMLFGPAPD